MFVARRTSTTLQRPMRRDQKQVESKTGCESGERRLLAHDRRLKQRTADDPIARIAAGAGRTHRPESGMSSQRLRSSARSTSTNTADLRLGFSPAVVTEPEASPSSNSDPDMVRTAAAFHAIEVSANRRKDARQSTNRPTANDRRTSPKQNSSRPTTPRKTVRCLPKFERTESIGPNSSETSRASCARPQRTERQHSCGHDFKWQSLISRTSLIPRGGQPCHVRLTNEQVGEFA